ncbi:hypothetical protein [Bradyrhizobium sp. SZCCHNR1070]|uniref:hypothetical protein n=1 Tax=Bradyrhizobium sp. SZCCHNR1070 TaxID=3057361 RepID=UPI002917141E|nr:hypothetical protein [Bradyrhizobium sp. SZCCHNR1070]
MRGASILLHRLGRTPRHACVAAMLMVSACALAGCASNNSASNSYAMATSTVPSDGATIAFDQIDGPPPQVFDRMVNVLDSESKLRSLAIVSREAPAAYRVRSYLSAQVVSGKSVVAWVWDVYDRNQQRTLRLSGEEPTGRAGRDATRDPWGAADDLVLRKIAQAGFSGLTSMLNGTAPADNPSQPAPASQGPAVATAAPADSAENTNVAALGYTDH